MRDGRNTALAFAAAAIAAAMAALSWASPAQAQGTFICPTGPGPGEQQIGMTPGGNGVASVPVCASSGPPPPPAVPMQSIPNYYAAAWHADARDAWFSVGFQSRERAEGAALSACNSAMGGGCTIAASNLNGAVVLARGVDGGLYIVDRAKRREAERAAKDYCRKQNDECEILRWATAEPGSAPVGQSVPENPEIYAPQGDPRRIHGAAVWLDKSKGNGRPHVGDVWVVGGRPSADKAHADALAACEAEYPGRCVVALSASDTLLTVVHRDGQTKSIATAASVELSKKRALDHCKEDKAAGKSSGKCTLAGTFNLSDEFVIRYDPSAEGKPFATAQAWVKGDSTRWGSSVWSVSGIKDVDVAGKAAQAACEKESGEACEVASSSFNSLVALYLDQNKSVRISSMARDIDPAERVAARCSAAAVTCNLVKVVDARVAARERIDLQ